MDDSPAMPPPLPVRQEPTPWGFWATIAFSISIAIGYLAPQIAIAVALAIIEAGRNGAREMDSEEFSARLGSDGAMLAIGVLSSVPIVVGMAVWFASLRKGISVRDYLGLHWPASGVIKRWGAALLVLIVISDGVTTLTRRPIVPEFMVDAYTSAGAFKIFLWLALLAGAPLTEEFLFRGFLFVGLARSKLGKWGTILVTSLSWALIHMQYDWFGITTVFLFGLFLGAARLRTGSLLCVLLHGLMNLIATTEVAVLTAMMS
jgi:membrane protease YdiL (CAAX protease family)